MWQIAQYSTGLYGSNSTSTSSGGSLAIILAIYLIVIVLSVVAFWRIFTKAGQAGWKAIIPLYNTVIILRIVGLSGWYVLLYLVPFVNIAVSIWVIYRLAKSFGYGIGVTILSIFAIGPLIIAFGDSKYIGPNGQPAGGMPPTAAPPAPQQPPAAPTPPQPPVTPQPPAPAV